MDRRAILPAVAVGPVRGAETQSLLNGRSGPHTTSWHERFGHGAIMQRCLSLRKTLPSRTDNEEIKPMLSFRTRRVSALLALVICGATISGSRSAQADQPDVLLIMVDDLRPMLGCYGDTRIQTPHIDRLAERGVLFERAYCQYAKCGTSRLSLLTGLRPDSIGVFSNNVRDVERFRKRVPNAVSLPRWLKQHGYHTSSFGKIYHDGWDSADDWSEPSSPGRDREMWEVTRNDQPARPTIIAERLDCPVLQSPDVPDNHLFAGRMTDQVVRILNERRGTQPSFLAVGFRRPHLPFIAPRRYFELYSPDESWLAGSTQPPTKSPVMAWFNSDGYVGSAKRIGLSMPVRPDRQQAIDWNGYEMRSYVGVPNRGPIARSLQLKLLQAYAACISYVDAQIGRLLTQLDESPRGKNTIVVLISDHGWHLGEHSAWGKMTNFEIATGVPMIIAGPGIKPARTRAIAELVDLYPTLCDLTSTQKPNHLQGESLTQTLKAPGEDRPDSFAVSQYSRFRDAYLGTALRTDRYRYVEWAETKIGDVSHRELYDHESDSAELNNLADDPQYAKLIQQLSARTRRSADR